MSEIMIGPMRRAVILMAVGLMASAAPCRAQGTMSFSFYSDQELNSDLSVLYTIVDGSDFSSGCSHSNYQTHLYVSGPDGSTSGDFGGLYASLDIPATEGSYWMGSSATATCSCIMGGTFSAGGASAGFGVEKVWSYYTNGERAGFGSCFYPTLNCLEGSAPHCGLGTVTLPLWSTILGCPTDAGAVFGKINWGDEYVCTLGLSWATEGAGWCT